MSDRPARPDSLGRHQRRGRTRHRRAQGRISLREAAEIVGVSEQTLRRYFLGTAELPRQPGLHYAVTAEDAHQLARGYATRVSLVEAAQRFGTTQAEIRRLLRDGVVPRTPGHGRPVRVDHLEQLVANGWKPDPDPAHDGRVPTHEAARGSPRQRSPSGPATDDYPPCVTGAATGGSGPITLTPSGEPDTAKKPEHWSSLQTEQARKADDGPDGTEWCRASQTDVMSAVSRRASKHAAVGGGAGVPAELTGPVEVELARAVEQIPGPKALAGGTVWEPKLDGYLY